ncbi:site-2 protease family protein [candidate division WOR-3 bacterium]|nr:site-2 protease family protein [candidate division WOR-3 bacterium]
MEKVLSIVVDGLIFLAQILLLIGFHELGHLLAGKLAKVPIDKFSIGFGPAIVKWKGGSTTYQLSIIPLGGYVKFKGEDFDDPEGFYAYSYWRKSVATIGGVVFNFLLAMVAYLVMGLAFGVATPSARLVFPQDSGLSESGFEVGDSVVSVEGKEIATFFDLSAYSSEDSLDVQVIRPVKQLLIDVPPSGLKRPAALPSGLKLVEPLDSSLLEAGLRMEDSILAINGVSVSSVGEIAEYFTDSETLRVRVLRPGKRIKLVTSGQAIADAEPLSGPVVGRVVKRTPAEDAGLKKGDRVIEVDGVPINFWNDFSEIVSNADTSRPIELVWLHQGDTVKALTKAVEMRFLTDKYVGIGVTAYIPNRPVTFLEALWLPVKRTGQVTANICIALVEIVRKPTQLKGVISVARYTSQFRRWGFDFILGMFASLSVTLAIINLLPIPALDGGRILMFTIEKIRRKQFGKKAWTIAVNIGFIVVIALIAWTLVSDIFFSA